MPNHPYLPIEKLKSIASSNKEKYAKAKPYPHAYFDDVFNPKILDSVIEEFEESNEKWQSFETKYEKKRQLNNDLEFGETTRGFIHALNSEPFLTFLSELTGINGLIPDPYLMGGGLHQLPNGGKLGVHVDFNYHKKMNAFRRINLLVYLNKDWKDEYGGHFELWNEDNSACVTRFLPTFNRMALFTTTATSFHGNPQVINCPTGMSRRSIALYYYTAGERGEQSSEEHSTIFLNEEGNRETIGKGSMLQRIKRKLAGK